MNHVVCFMIYFLGRYSGQLRLMNGNGSKDIDRDVWIASGLWIFLGHVGPASKLGEVGFKDIFMCWDPSLLLISLDIPNCGNNQLLRSRPQTGHPHQQFHPFTGVHSSTLAHPKEGLMELAWAWHTVDGRNPAPADMVNIPLFTGFYTSQVVQDFLHPQCPWENSAFRLDKDHWPLSTLSHPINPWSTVDGSEIRRFHQLRLVVYPRWWAGFFVHQR